MGVRLSLLMHAAAGIALGAASLFLGGALFALFAAIVLASVLKRMTERLTGKKDFASWAGGGLILFLFCWIDAWIFFVNAAA